MQLVHLVLGRPIGRLLFSHLLSQVKLVLEVFHDAFCLHGQTIYTEIFQFGKVTA